MSKRNPDNNSVLQACLDLADRGMETWALKDIIARLRSDPKLSADLQKGWNAHAYPEKSMVYAQLGINQQMYTLSDTALRIITFLGLYCHQSGLIQARLEDVCSAVGVGRTSAKKAFTELCSCGALVMEVPSAQHAAPVYRVNPALVNKGTRRKTDVAAFTGALAISPDDYLLARKLELVVKTESIRTDTMAYNRLYLVPAAQTAKKRPSRRKPASASTKETEQIPGQMSIYDYVDKEAAGNG